MSADFSKWKLGTLLKNIDDGEILLVLKESGFPSHFVVDRFLIIKESIHFETNFSTRRAGTMTNFLFEDRVRVINEI